MMIKNCLIFTLLTSLSGFCLADAMCGPGGEFNPGDNQCYPVQDRRTSSPPPQKVDLWGAMAADTNGTTGGTNQNARTSQEAERKALATCGLSTCKILVTFRNSCGAVAANADIYAAGGIGNTPAQAERAALEKCQNDRGKPCVIWFNGKCSRM